MMKRQVLANAVVSVAQIVANGGLLFFLYRFLLKSLGPEQLGVWSLVLATTAVTNLASLGLSGSVVKFVAKYLARREMDVVSKIVTTASLSIGGFIGLALLAAYPTVRWVLGKVVASEHFPAALTVLPYSLLSLWIMSITGVFQSGLDGAQRIDLRNYLTMLGALLYLILCLVFVPHYGLTGVAYSQVIQSVSLLIASWLALARIIPGLSAIRIRWDRSVFKEIIGYGMNFQIISVAGVFYDPMTKAFLSRFGGLPSVGYFEMASKMIQQFRALIVSANQVLVPAIAELHENAPQKIKEIFLTSYRLLFYLALPLYSVIMICLPAVSRVWIGRYERSFIVFGILLSIGWFLNTLNVPSYFVYMGIGDLRWNVLGHIATGLLNAGAGFCLGLLFDGIGVVLGWTVSLALGSSLVYLSFHVKNKIPLKELIPEMSRPMLGVSLAGVLLATFVFFRFHQHSQIMIIDAATTLSLALIISLFVWLHPMRRQLARWAKMIWSEKRLS